MSIIATTDFDGDVKINLGKYVSDDLQACIDQIEREVLIDLLGYDLYAAFIASFTGNPSLPPVGKYRDLLNGTGEFQGIKGVLKYFIYYEWIRLGNFFNAVTGVNSVDAENGKQVSRITFASICDRAYNNGVALYSKANDWIEEINSAEPITSISGTTVYTADTKYLVNDDTVLINGIEYTISSVVADTSFVTNTAVGAASSWSKEFFEDYENTERCVSIWGGSL